MSTPNSKWYLIDKSHAARPEMLHKTIYQLLDEDARRWWYNAQLRSEGRHKEARKRERESIRSNIGHIRECLANGGYAHIGRGGNTLYYDPNARLEGFGDLLVFACIRAGIPVIDTRFMDLKILATFVYRGPIMGFKDDPFGSNPDSPLSTRKWNIIWNRYAKADSKCLFYNYIPTDEIK